MIETGLENFHFNALPGRQLKSIVQSKYTVPYDLKKHLLLNKTTIPQLVDLYHLKSFSNLIYLVGLNARLFEVLAV